MASAIEKILQLASSNLFDNASVSTCLTAVTDLSNNLDTRVNSLIDNAPGALNTLNELAAALGDDANYATTVTNSLSTKANLNGAAFTGDISGVNAKFMDVSGVNFFTTGGNFIGELVGNVTGNVTGNVQGSLTTGGTVIAGTYNIGSVGIISGSRQINNVISLNVGNGNDPTEFAVDNNGNTSMEGILSVNTINEKTSANGVTVDGVILKDGNVQGSLTTGGTVIAGTYNIGSVGIISGSRQINNVISLNVGNGNDPTEFAVDNNGNTSMEGILSVNTINEKTSANGVTVDGVILKDSGIIISGDLSANDASFNIVDIHTLKLTTGLDDSELKEDYIKTNEVDGVTLEFFDNTTLRIKDSGITDVKLSTITTSGKVNGSAITGDISANDASFNRVDIHTLNLTTGLGPGDLEEDYIKTNEVDNSTIEFTSDTLNVKNLGITNAKLANLCVDDSKLAGNISDVKLSTITTAGKVNGSAITGDISANDVKFNDVSGVNFFGGNFFGNLQGNAATVVVGPHTNITGIGTLTSSPENDRALDVSGNIKLEKSGMVDTFVELISNNKKGYLLNNDGTLKLHTNISSNNLILQGTGGNVGIGTNNPGAKLEVFNGNINIKSGGPQVELISQDGKDGWTLNANVSDTYRSGRFRIISKDNNSYPSGAEKFTILRNGNVGIGTTSPESKLHVIKNLRVGYQINSKAGIVLSDEDGFGGNYPNIQSITKTGAANNLTINPNGGKVGIGTNSPSYPLEIYGSYNGAFYHGQAGVTLYGVSLPNYNSTHTWSGTWYTNYYGFPTISLKTQNGIYCGGQLFITSDERIKENIQDVSDNVALQQLRDISCCFYQYKDKVIMGTEKTIGFIAQQVREHMPMAVSIQKGIIPNEMRKIENPQWTTVTDASGNNTYKLTIPDLEDASGNTSETTKYRFYVSNDPSGNDECEKEITSLENEPKSFIFEEQWQNVFLYGKEVDDFHTLDKQKLFAINFSASQEIDRIQQQEKIKLEEQTSKLLTAEAKIVASEAKIVASEEKITSLETIVANLLTRIAALENP